ncbi:MULTISPECIES: hypothetical protein [Serratia]|uniref:hypothetical protein n=1 Tax=Serratia TaxID=613 RepID=UPI001041F42E|nr:hypothetical protein [Serratia marcescens]MBN5292436.1 hypothetical protein [Serratia marcescens]MDP0517969.1 hypothetical protein [Serratia marcescens]MDV2100183.1 hypothetical protein [Serratia marcescens]HCU0892066.1 hypothetical protein [Serratia marcescens]HEB0052224.1 hypothetical protein [Serratia marcescens]
MKKLMIGLVVLGLAGCAMSYSDIRKNPTQTFSTTKTLEQMETCLIPKLDSETYNGPAINTTVKPLENGVTLVPLAGLEFIDLLKINTGTKVVYYGEGTRSVLFPERRIKVTLIAIKSCL